MSYNPPAGAYASSEKPQPPFSSNNNYGPPPPPQQQPQQQPVWGSDLPPQYGAVEPLGTNAPVAGIPLSQMNHHSSSPPPTAAGGDGGGSGDKYPPGSGMPPKLPNATPLRENIAQRTVAFGAGECIELSDCEVRECHLTDAYLRNCRVFGGAFSECSFKSCVFTNVHHCYEGKLDDCQVGEGSTLVECALKRCETKGADLRDCKARTT